MIRVSGAVDPARPSTSPDRGLSAAQRQLTAEVLGVATAAFSSSASPGALRTCLAALRSIVPKVTSKLGSPVSPMRSEPAIYGFSQRCPAGGTDGLMSGLPRRRRSVGTRRVARNQYTRGIGVRRRRASWANLKKVFIHAPRAKATRP